MPRIADQILEIPCFGRTVNLETPSVLSDGLFRDFVDGLKFVMTFCHDIDSPPMPFINNPTTFQIIDFPDLFAELRTAMDHGLYRDRTEREELVKALRLYKMVLFRSLLGEGKSSVMLSAFNSFNNSRRFCPLYLDFNKMINELNTRLIDDNNEPILVTPIVGPIGDRLTRFSTILTELVLDKLLEIVVHSANGEYNKLNWKAAQIPFRDPNRKVRKEIESILNNDNDTIHTIRGVDDILKVAIDEKIRTIIDNFEDSPTIPAIAEYARLQDIYIVILADNIDMFPILYQEAAVNTFNNISRYIQFACAIALREGNFQTLGQHNIQTRILQTVPLRALLHAEASDEYFYSGIHPFDQMQLLEDILISRVDLLRDHILKQLYKTGQNSGSVKIDINTVGSFIDSFVKQYKDIAKGLVRSGLYSLSNHSLRDLLNEVTFQVLRVLYGPEKEHHYQLEKEYLDARPGKDGRKRTLLRRRSFYYKLSLSKSECVPTFKSGLINVFDNALGAPISVYAVILDYLCRTYQRYNPAGQAEVTIRSASIVIDEICRLGFTENEVNHAIEYLCNRETPFARTGMLESNFRSAFGEETRRHLILLPAGKFFVLKLMTTCEYAFWAIAQLQLESSVISSGFGGAQSYKEVAYNDLLKATTVYTYLASVGLESYKRFYCKILDGPGESWWKFAVTEYCVDELPYAIRLIQNIITWLRNAKIENEDDRMLLIKRYNILEEEYRNALALW
jgi:hypothetical protein